MDSGANSYLRISISEDMTNIINSTQVPHFDVSWDGPKVTDTQLDDAINNMTVYHIGRSEMTVRHMTVCHTGKSRHYQSF